MKKILFLLIFGLFATAAFAQITTLLDFHLVGINEKEFCRITKTTVIATNSDILNESIPHHSYSTTWGPLGDPINLAVRYDSNGLSDLVGMGLTVTDHNPVLWVTTFMMLQTRGTILGKDDSGTIYSRQQEGAVFLTGQGSAVVGLFLMTPAVAKGFGITGY